MRHVPVSDTPIDAMSRRFTPLVRFARLFLSIAPLLLPTPSTLAGEEPGVLLVAAPGYGGPDFSETVLLLKRHARGGTLGVILNRPTATRVDELFPGVQPPIGLAAQVYAGGPAEPEQVVFLVRTRSHAPRNALPVFDNVFLAHDRQLLSDILRHPVPLMGMRVFRGHARWDRGELETAIARGEWYLAEADADALFEDDPGSLWQRLVARVEKQGVSVPDRDRAAKGGRAVAHW